MRFIKEFEEYSRLDENYDPLCDKESGYYSKAYVAEYIEYLESIIVKTLKGGE